MMRIKLFGLFIAFALLALVRPRKCLELLEAADAGTAAVHREALRAGIHTNGPLDYEAARRRVMGECTLPPPGWRCTRAAGHDGPCAAVATHMPGPMQ